MTPARVVEPRIVLPEVIGQRGGHEGFQVREHVSRECVVLGWRAGKMEHPVEPCQYESGRRPAARGAGECRIDGPVKPRQCGIER